MASEGLDFNDVVEKGERPERRPSLSRRTEQPQTVNVSFPLGATVLTSQTLKQASWLPPLKNVRLWTSEGWQEMESVTIQYSYKAVGRHDVNTQFCPPTDKWQGVWAVVASLKTRHDRKNILGLSFDLIIETS